MQTQLIDANRRKALVELDLLDATLLEEFNVLTRLATMLLGTKISLFSVIDGERQIVKGRVGLEISEAPRRHSFCAKAMEGGVPLLVPDMQQDGRFATNPFVAGEPHIRFYAGVPVNAKSIDNPGEVVPIGAFCVMDQRPRSIDGRIMDGMADLAMLAESLIEARALSLRTEKLARDRQRTFEQLTREHRQLKQAERLANVGSWRLTLDDMKTQWSDQVYAIHELPHGKKPALSKALDFYPEEERVRLTETLEHTIRSGIPYDIETDFITAKGNRRRVRAVGETEVVNGETVAVLGVIQDVTERHQLEQSLRQLAETDDLTKLPNRASFNRVLAQETANAKTTGKPLVLLLIDLDGFKLVNDTCGHNAGDDVLQRTARILRSDYLADCYAARLGGDEFVVVMSGEATVARADKIVDQLLADLCYSVGTPVNPIRVSGTIGIARFDETVISAGDMLLRADNALYKGKRLQRGTAQTYS